MGTTKLLFVAEDVTLAQLVRLVTLASSLDSERYEVHFAASRFDDLVFAGTRFVRHVLTTLPADVAERALVAGKRLYEKRTLLEYMRAELELFERVKPALVIGDFRLSLSSSAELWGVPSAVLINAYWSPFAVRERFPVPDHPFIRLLGEARVTEYFPKAIPHVFAHFAAPLNAARKRHGLPPVGSLLQMLTHGDYTLYPDEPWLTPVQAAPSSHRFLGPVLWEPDVPEPQLQFGNPGQPLIYVTLGSSGKVDLLPQLVAAAATLPFNFVVATAGRAKLGALPVNLQAFPFVPGSTLARKACLVISNGGSTTGYQALAEGTPVLGIPSNFDQFLASAAIAERGAGKTLKARAANIGTLQSAIAEAVNDTTLRAGAARVAERFGALDSRRTFALWLEEALAQGERGPKREGVKAKSIAL
jgi:UDP:flavonoid glycosyltransferase YjiC (YdhE family)